MSNNGTDRRQKAMAEVKINRLKEAVVWKKAFSTEDGKKCLDLLKAHYYDVEHIAHNDPTITQNRSAQRDLVRYIMSQVEYTGE